MRRYWKLPLIILFTLNLLLILGCSNSISIDTENPEANQGELTELEIEGNPTVLTEKVAEPASNLQDAATAIDPNSPVSNSSQPVGTEEDKAEIRLPVQSAATSAYPGEAEQNQVMRANDPSGAQSPTQSNVPAAKQALEQDELQVVQQTEQKLSATLAIFGPQDEGLVILAETEVEVQDGDTVLELLKRTAKEHKMQMEYSGRQATAYVEGIDNLYEFDRGTGSGWVYRVNGQFSDRSAGVWPVSVGDKIEWLYTLDLGRDVGGRMQGTGGQ